MKTYKLYHLYEQNKERAITLLNNLYIKDKRFLMDGQWIAVPFDEGEQQRKELYDRMRKLPVRQAMFIFLPMRRLIQELGEVRYQLNIELAETVTDNLLTVIEGCIKRIEIEPNELLRRKDLNHLIACLHSISSEGEADISVLHIQNDRESFSVYSNGVLKISDGMDIYNIGSLFLQD